MRPYLTPYFSKYKNHTIFITKIQKIMVKIQAQGKVITCEAGANLRRVLLKNDVDLYNGNASLINCRGIGTCGTCAVEIEGDVSEMKWQEKARLSVPPHSPNTTKRLACKLQVLGDIKVTKYDGFWGQGTQTEWTPEA
jgi:ferredoxin